MAYQKEKTCVNLSAILLIGSFCAAALLALGLGMLLFGGPAEGHLTTLTKPGFSSVFSLLLRGEPVAIISLGILVMMFTPFLRVVTAVFSFFTEKDYLYAGVAFGVMLILLFSILPSFI
jgi:uncharacterized membrane protein